MNKRNTIYWTLFFVVALAAPAAAEQAKTPEWWEIAAGIAAIPTGIVGIVTAYYTAVKSRLEARKLELDLRTQEAALAASPAATDGQRALTHSLIDPLVDNTKVNYFVMRFVLLYLMLQFWDVLSKVANFVVGGAYMTLTQVLHLASDSKILQFGLIGLTEIIQFGWIILVLLIGLPLYKDIAGHIGFKFSFRRPTLDARNAR
jgi:hypothetical protein